MVQIIKVRDNMITGVEIELVVIPEPKKHSSCTSHCTERSI